MRHRSLLTALIVLGTACRRQAPLPAPIEVLGVVAGDAVSRTVIDSGRGEVVLYAGPFRVPSMSSMAGMPGMPEMSGVMVSAIPGDSSIESHGAHAFSPLVRFEWPVEGWFRGFRLSLVDAHGAALPRSLMHHLVGINFERRQLLQADFERFLAVGAETPDIVLPRLIGIPMKAGSRLGIYVGWHNPTAKDLDSVYMRLAFPYIASNALLKPIGVFPVQMDVNNTPGQMNAYDLPPGPSTKSFEFEMPLSGRFLGIGGHLHDYGVEVRLEDMESRDVLTRVVPVRDSVGRVLSLPRKYFPFRGLRLTAGHRYRVVGQYAAMQRDTVGRGAMAIMAGLFVPVDPAKWPPVRLDDPLTQADLESLPGGSHVTAPVIGAMAPTGRADSGRVTPAAGAARTPRPRGP